MRHFLPRYCTSILSQAGGGCINYFVYYMLCNTVNRIRLRADCIRVTGGVLGAVLCHQQQFRCAILIEVCRSTILATQPVPVADDECLSYHSTT